MSRLVRLVRLPPAERRLLVLAVLLLGGIAGGLRVLPFQTVRQFLRRIPRARWTGGRATPLRVDRIAWAVTTAARYVPGARTCLPQALAAEALFGRCGLPARLRIGVAPATGGPFEAHAWVEATGHVVFGAAHPGRYTPLPPF